MWSGLYFKPSSPSRWTGQFARADAAALFERGQRECGSSLRSIAAYGASDQRFRLGPERQVRGLYRCRPVGRDHARPGQGEAVPSDDPRRRRAMNAFTMDADFLDRLGRDARRLADTSLRDFDDFPGEKFSQRMPMARLFVDFRQALISSGPIDMFCSRRQIGSGSVPRVP